MKFEYEKAPDRGGEPVAYIDRDGDLHIKDQPDGIFSARLRQDGATFGSTFFDPHDPTNIRVFYAGDSITITF